MATRPLPRKSQLFLDGVLPVTVNYDELVAAKFKRGKFVFTVTGGVKIIGIVSKRCSCI